ncbi:MAG: EamA family transporter [Butyricicoccus sp.]
MISYYWPIALIVLSNVAYHICSKSTPTDIDPFAALTFTYLVGAVVSGILYVLLHHDANLLQEYRQLNWSSLLLGIAIVGLESGSIYMYKAGWNISSGQLVYSSLLTILLIFIGRMVYHEPITPTKIAGIGICMVGLYLINK